MANLFDKAANIAMEKVNPSPKISIMSAMEGKTPDEAGRAGDQIFH